MELTTSRVGDVLVVAFEESTSLEGDRSAHFKRVFRELIDEGHRRVVLDASQVVFIDSQGLGALISSLKSLRSKGGDLKLVNVSESLVTVLEVTRLARVFESHDEVDAAVGAFA